ncbi:MAG: type II toxin-antitoxin system VapC family toxin [Actinobacteria bacterium]|nr:type II toxin-antitoxin system VapC family toxin [Actinomycetota bacterium]
MKLLDTYVLIDFLRSRDEAVEIVRSAASAREWIGASEITRFELLAGLRPGEEKETEQFSSELGWVPVTEPIARQAASLARRYRGSHGGIEDVDYLIAATALELDATLMTTNVRHFPMFPGLEPAYRLA